MGLFKKKKKEMSREEQPQISFPDIPKEDYDSPIMDKDMSDIKKGVGLFDDFEIPVRKSTDDSRTFGPKFSPDMDEDVKRAMKEERPVFIKLDKYKMVIKSINDMKRKIEETQEIIAKLEDVKKEEDMQLQKWHDDLETLKERLLSIDSTLFEE
ncbi:MAG: hypothetical protein PHE43_01145 [Candidatus Nanoarchaeia archaeon]|nr:hypothetical protein [Candidatus Nanoarchaeia archaeon]